MFESFQLVKMCRNNHLRRMFEVFCNLFPWNMNLVLLLRSCHRKKLFSFFTILVAFGFKKVAKKYYKNISLFIGIS